MATLSVSPANVPEGSEVSFVLTGDLRVGFCYRVRITDKSIAGAPSRFLDPVRVTDSDEELRWDFSTSGLAIGSYEAVAECADPGARKSCPSPTDGKWTEVEDSTIVRLTVDAPAVTTRSSMGVGAGVDSVVITPPPLTTLTTRTFLQRASANPTPDQALWVAIRNRTNALSFDRYEKFINLVFCDPKSADLWTNAEKKLKEFLPPGKSLPLLNIRGPYAYSVLKLATQVFLTLEAGVVINEHRWGGPQLLDPENQEQERYRLNDPTATFVDLREGLDKYLVGSSGGEVLPYLNRIVGSLLALNAEEQNEEQKDVQVLPYCYGVLQHRFTQPSLIELIWSYWQEEGMLAQTMNAIAMRFQNQRSGPNDPLAELEIDPLRPLNNLIWGYVQDEHNRLTVRRRAFEYDHHYGLRLLGRAVPEMRTADSRSKFIEAFHNLLYRTAIFYREAADTTVIADAFPLLNALKDVHLLLAEGAHNQYGDLPWTARAEMLTQQWLLARPEMREFLRGRHMVPYQELWMGTVDAMKKLQGWTDTTISHFHELAVDGERLLLSIRFGHWSELDNIEEQARNWAHYWKPEVQRYLYGYLAATGVDLMADITDSREAAIRYLQPSLLLQRRLEAQARKPALSAPQATPARALNAPTFAGLSRAERARALKYQKGN